MRVCEESSFNLRKATGLAGASREGKQVVIRKTETTCAVSKLNVEY